VIRYVQAKQINTTRIQELLAESATTNTFTNDGPIKRKLEQKLAEVFGLDDSRKVVCTSSGTAALFIAVSLLEKKAAARLDWVTPDFNFPSAVVNRLKTAIKDINLDDYTLDTQTLYHGMTKSQPYTGLIITTLFGTVPDLSKIETYCKENNASLILDNASSPLSWYEGERINNYGDVCIGSLHHTKYLGFGEGGYLVVNSDDYTLANSLTNFGFQDTREYKNMATNAKMSDIAAAYILSHVESYDIDRHLKVQYNLVDAITDIPNVEVFNYGVTDDVLGNLPLLFKLPISHLNFRDVGIEANKYYKPLTGMPNSVWLYERMVNLPLHSGLTDYEIDLMLTKVEYEAKAL